MSAVVENGRLVRSTADVISVMMRLRLVSEGGEAAYDWFTRVYVPRLAALVESEKARKINPHKSNTMWPSPSAVATGFDMPHLDVATLQMLGAALVKIGFRLPATTKGPIDLRLVTFPPAADAYNRWLYVQLLVEAGTILMKIDAHADGIAHLVRDYVINVTCASAEHFALAWVVGPYREQMQRDGARDPLKTDTNVAYGLLILPDVLRVAIDRRADTETAARKHWPKDPKAEERAWNAIAALFGRLGFPAHKSAKALERFQGYAASIKPAPVGNGLMGIAALNIPETDVLRASMCVALEELADQHALVHHRSKKNIRFDVIKRAAPAKKVFNNDPFAALVASVLSETSTPLACHGREPGDWLDDGEEECVICSRELALKHTNAVIPVIGVIDMAPADAAKMDALKKTIEALTEVVAAQNAMIAKAALKDAGEDKRDAEIVTEAGQMRAELSTLRLQADALRKEAEYNAEAVRKATALAEQYRKSYEDATRVTVAVRGGAGGPPPPPPPPPPVNGAQQIAALTVSANKSTTSVAKTAARIVASEASIAQKLGDVERKAEANAGARLFNVDDLKRGANGLRKVEAAAKVLNVQKRAPGDVGMMEALKKVLAVRRKSVTGDDAGADDGAFNARTMMRARLAHVLYEVMSFHA